jgi:hypothetical protein
MLLAVCAIAIAVVLGVTLLLTMNSTQANSQTSTELNALQMQYYALEQEYANLQGNYTAMLNAYNQLQSQSYGDAYNTLKAEYDQYLINYQRLRGQINLQAFAGPAEALITPSEPSVIALVQSITGKANISNTSVQNWSDIKTIYDWVKNNIQYREDPLYPILPADPASDVQIEQQMVQFANQTLLSRQGDSASISVLLCSMLRAYDPHVPAEVIWIASNSSRHLAVQIPVAGNKLVILDTVKGYYTNDFFGNIAFNGIQTEITSWLNVWKPSMGTDAYVYRVFSDYVDTTFNNTSEYITWMQNR